MKKQIPEATTKRKDADHIFYEFTRSICPECRKVIDARIILRNGKVYMRKRCPDCGPFEGLVYGDAEMYVSQSRYNKPGAIPLEFGTDIEEGCPYDCGLCPDHQQHACLGIIEVNSTCNMDCPLCFSEAAPGFNLTLEEVEEMLDDFVRTEGNPEVVQFSGGEPTIHPQIVDFLRAAKARIPFTMVNTNGKRIANDDAFLAEMAEVRPSFYFQFDGFDSETYRIIRGEPRILEEKLRALDRLAEAGLSATLVPAIERGVNDHEVGKIIEFAIKHPAVRAVNFQPAFHAGRHMAHDPMERMTIPDVLKRIEEQTAGKFLVSDFVPVPCCFPTCNSVTYAFVDGEEVTPIPRLVDVHDYLDYIANRALPDLNQEVLTALEGLWSSSSVPGSDKSAQQLAVTCQACGIPESFAPERIADRMIMIMLQDFMDPWTFNQKNLMKCCKEFLLPGNRQIPFCAYNTLGYREQARAQLVEAEPARRRARTEGARFEPATDPLFVSQGKTMSEAAGPRTSDENLKSCCARLYEQDIVPLLLGESYHPGGFGMTSQLSGLLNLTPDSRVLDVASGNGASAMHIARTLDCEVVGIDYSAENVDKANAAAAGDGLAGRVRFAEGDSERLPVADESFDAIVCECAFCTFQDKSAAAREFRRVLRAGGRLGMSDITRSSTLPDEFQTLMAWVACIADARTIAEYTAILESAGLQVEHAAPVDDALREMVGQIRMKLFGLEVAAALKKIELPGVNFESAKAMALAAVRAIDNGQLGYALIQATKV